MIVGLPLQALARGHPAHAGRAYRIPDALYGALLFYAAASTVLRSLVLGKPLDFDVAVPGYEEATGQPQEDTAEAAVVAAATQEQRRV